MKIPLYSPTICRSEMEAVLTRMVEERVGPGEVNKALSSLASEYIGSVYATSFRSPPIALHYAISALDIPANSSIIISALSPFWVYTELKRDGFNPIIIDVAPDSFFMDIEKVKEKLEQAKAIIINEPLGLMPNMEELTEFGLPIIEDISQSIGATYTGIKAGTKSNFALLGLEEHDILTAGGGAILLANKKEEASSLKKLYADAPLTDLLPDINASLGLVQLKQNLKNTEAKQEIFEVYKKALLQTSHKTIMVSSDDANPVYSFPIIFNSNVAEIEKFALKKEIEIEATFKNSCIAFLKELQEEYINASSMLFRCFLFPLYPRLGKKKIVEIAKILSSLP
ncbi:MAG: DegT/DnrJ/EryC1/StrS family aminotransferase [Treponema sp.]